MQTSFSKVLLFGEHTVVNGGRALAMPFSHFRGTWSFSTNDIHRGLSDFADYIDHHDYLYKVISVDDFFSDLDRGLIFESDIPIGYGLGSSGALVSALYKRYALSSETIGHVELQKHLADLESHFHGKSSGVDPLICYLNQPILIKNNSISILDSLPLPKEEYQLFLMNTGVSRSTGPLVERFQAYIGEHKNNRRILDEYIPIVNKAINALIAEDGRALYGQMESISGYQYAYLDFLIDEGSKDVWKAGLASDYFKLKICGAGGGGYLLGITNDLSRLISNYPSRDIIPVR